MSGLIRHLLSLDDLTTEEITLLIKAAINYKNKMGKDISYKAQGKILGMIFEKPSTRTRISFESAMIKLGGGVCFMTSQSLQLSRGEPICDTARVLSGYLDCLVIRTYAQSIVEEMAKRSSIPIINGLTDLYHPCQAISDVMTVVENFGDDLSKIKIAWIGDGNNVCNSWIQIASKLGFELHIATPCGYEPRHDILENAMKEAKAPIIVCNDPLLAAQGASVINTDVWLSMGEENKEEKKEAFKHFQVNNMLVALAKNDCIVLHCLPAHRGEEITDDVIEGENSRIWEQAENKMYTHMAIIEWLMGL
jgi:ornithine carbamoyltransferase